MTQDDHRVDASPDKRLFIDTLTRDIQLIPAIADLVDNSVDGALRVLLEEDEAVDSSRRRDDAETPLAGFQIAISLDGTQFSITDNCGGIEEEVARKYAFRFGRSNDWESVPHGVGQFGVGMKRAFYKLGRWFRVESTAAESHWILEVDVDDWADDEDDWEFALNEVEVVSSDLDDRGTSIRVERLQPDVRRSFEDKHFKQTLRAQLELHHQSPLEQGISIKVDGASLKPYRPTLLYSRSVRPIVRTVELDTPVGSVAVTIRAGIADDLDAPEPEKRTQSEKAGWYVFCNERLILAASKDESTGWGMSTAHYHPQYRAFRGFCYIDADDPAALPWNTTKTGLDLESPVYKRARQEMSKALKEVQAALNALKTERQRVDEPEDRTLEKALTSAAARAPKSLPTSSKFVFPKASREKPGLVNVLYKVETSRMEEVQDALGASSAKEAGKRTFDYFYENEVEE